MANGNKSGVYNPFVAPTEYTYPQGGSGGFYEQDRALFNNVEPFRVTSDQGTNNFFGWNPPSDSGGGSTPWVNPGGGPTASMSRMGATTLQTGMENAGPILPGASPAYSGSNTKFPGMFERLGASGFGQRFGANMATPQAMAGAASGIGGIIQGLAGRGKRRNAQIAAQDEYDTMKQQYLDLDTSNIYKDVENMYANLENPYEDLIVNKQQAEFEAQQGAQNRANIMSNLQGAAGSSGIAGLAQAMANQGQIQAQQAAGSIGLQESRNQMAKAQGAMQIQQMERKGADIAQQMMLSGEETARSLDWQKTGTLFGMAQQDLAAADQAIAQSNAALYGGIGQIAGTAAIAAVSDRKMKKNINLIGQSPSGLNIYNFEYINSKHGDGMYQGVLSDEIPSNAIIDSGNGYDMVNYSMIDVEFKRIN